MQRSVQSVLADIKMLGKQIARGLDRQFAVFVPSGSDLNLDEVQTEVTANWQSVNAMISRRSRLRAVVQLSNATTYVDVAGMKMTVGEAIDMKTQIDYLRRLTARAARDLSTSESDARAHRSSIDNQAQRLFGDKSEGNVDLESLEKYVAARQGTVVISKGLQKDYPKLVEKIEQYERDIDLALNTSNALTMVEV